MRSNLEKRYCWVHPQSLQDALNTMKCIEKSFGKLNWYCDGAQPGTIGLSFITELKNTTMGDVEEFFDRNDFYTEVSRNCDDAVEFSCSNMMPGFFCVSEDNMRDIFLVLTEDLL